MSEGEGGDSGGLGGLGGGYGGYGPGIGSGKVGMGSAAANAGLGGGPSAITGEGYGGYGGVSRAQSLLSALGDYGSYGTIDTSGFAKSADADTMSQEQSNIAASIRSVLGPNGLNDPNRESDLSGYTREMASQLAQLGIDPRSYSSLTGAMDNAELQGAMNRGTFDTYSKMADDANNQVGWSTKIRDSLASVFGEPNTRFSPQSIADMQSEFGVGDKFGTVKSQIQQGNFKVGEDGKITDDVTGQTMTALSFLSGLRSMTTAGILGLPSALNAAVNLGSMLSLKGQLSGYSPTQDSNRTGESPSGAPTEPGGTNYAQGQTYDQSGEYSQPSEDSQMSLAMSRRLAGRQSNGYSVPNMLSALSRGYG